MKISEHSTPQAAMAEDRVLEERARIQAAPSSRAGRASPLGGTPGGLG